jgi:hypothetical protein
MSLSRYLSDVRMWDPASQVTALRDRNDAVSRTKDESHRCANFLRLKPPRVPDERDPVAQTGGAGQRMRTAARIPVDGEALEPKTVSDLTDIVWPINHPSARLAIRKTVPGPLDHDQPNPALIGDGVRATHTSVKSRPGRAAEEHDRTPLRSTIDRVPNPPTIIERDSLAPHGHHTPLSLNTITILWATAESGQPSAAAEPGPIAAPSRVIPAVSPRKPIGFCDANALSAPTWSFVAKLEMFAGTREQVL